VRALWVDGYGVRVGAKQGALYVKDGKGETSIPLSDIDAVVLASSGITISSRAMRLMMGAGIELIILDSRGMPVGVLHYSYYTRTPTTRRAQYEAYFNGLGLKIVWSIVEGKLRNQACALRELYRGQRFLRKVEERILGIIAELENESQSPGGLEEARRRARSLEAWGAREYWGALARLLAYELGFRGRDRGSGDPVNTILNYGYGILYSIAFRELAIAGLDPYAGFLHIDRSGRPVLVYDFVELFRAHAVDLPLVKLILKGWKPSINSGLLSHDTRRRIASEILGQLKRSRLNQAIRRSALELAKSLRARSAWKPWRGCEL